MFNGLYDSFFIFAISVVFLAALSFMILIDVKNHIDDQFHQFTQQCEGLNHAN